jgi:hypothetical protein
MAILSVIKRNSLKAIDVLAPERYDPRRALNAGATETILLGDVVCLIRRVVHASENLGQCLVFDTSDACEGIVIGRKELLKGSEIGSAKKVIEPRDVIISRLRPYLRQVAFVDAEIPNARNALILCSTEFFILRSRDNRSIAFLVPLLLSRKVQEVLAVSQEGGHHPRFDDTTLLTLPVPVSLIDSRDYTSHKIEDAIKKYRQSEMAISEAVAAAEQSFQEE